MHSYHDLLRYVTTHGRRVPTRAVLQSTGEKVSALSCVGVQWRHHLGEGFPLLTTKAVHWKSVETELRWFLDGGTNVRTLQAQGVRIWNEWADVTGEVGPVYGHAWRHWCERDKNGDPLGPDQIESLIDGVCATRDDPTASVGRRLILNAWNYPLLGRMKLPPCHLLAQWFVRSGSLSCMVTMRSADVFLGVPFNIASYALLLHLLAHRCGLTPGELVFSFGDLHLYENHLPQAEVQLGRAPYSLPTLTVLRTTPTLRGLVPTDYRLDGYRHHDKLPGEVAV